MHHEFMTLGDVVWPVLILCLVLGLPSLVIALVWWLYRRFVSLRDIT